MCIIHKYDTCYISNKQTSCVDLISDNNITSVYVQVIKYLATAVFIYIYIYSHTLYLYVDIVDALLGAKN